MRAQRRCSAAPLRRGSHGAMPRPHGPAGACAMLETRDLTDPLRRPRGGRSASPARFAPGTLTAIVGPERRRQDHLLQPDLRPAARPAPGQVSLDGADITALPAPARTHRGLGRAFQLTSCSRDLTVLENVRLAVQARAARKGLNLWRGLERPRATLIAARRRAARARRASATGATRAAAACRTATSASSRSRC